MRKWTIPLVVILFLFSFVACGKDNTVIEEEISSDTTVEVMIENFDEEKASNEPEVLESITEPTEMSAEELEKTSTEETAETLEEEPTESPIEEPADETSEEPTVAPERETGNFATPATAPTSTYHSGDGSDILFTGTVTLPYTNITVPMINQFNYFSLIAPGYGTEEADTFYQRFYEVVSEYQPQIDAIFQERGAISKDLGYIITDENGEHRVSLTYGLTKSGWDAHGNAIHNWYDISIQKREPREGLPFNYYLLDINNPLKWTAESRAANDWPNIYSDAYMAAAYDALLYLLTFYTSTPEEVAQGVMDMIYGETLYDPWEWYAFGDCLIRFHYADYAEDSYQFNIVGNY